MAGNLRRGFKAAAERLAQAVRKDFAMDSPAPFDCIKVCGELGIPVISVPDLVSAGASPRSIRHILSPAAKFSAMTVASGTKRLIVYNPTHSAGRRANSLAHELSHILLEHPLAPALGEGGCRLWDPRLEAEADWQAGALLVPRDAALAWLQSNRSMEEGAAHFGVSKALFQWRVGQTGVKRQMVASSISYQRRWLA
jgi:Zn-dependent peptidase ImmA (M78 family)